MKRLSQWSRSGRGKKAPCSACFAWQLSWLSLNAGGQGFLPATVGILPPATFIGNKRKIKPKAGHSSCSNTRQLISFTQQLEILVTSLLLCSTMCDCVSMPLTATVHNNRGLSGGQVLPYISHIVMCPPPLRQRAGILHCFGLKTGIDFTRFGLESGTVWGNYEMRVYEQIYCFNFKWVRKEETCKFEMDFVAVLI